MMGRTIHGFVLTAAVALLGLPLLAGMGGCKAECEENLHCDVGEICNKGQCEAADCYDSSDCEMESYCSDDSGSCEAGCQSDRDCYPYHSCNAQDQCVNMGCRSTTLDCAMGEFCDLVTGECHEATGAYCRECDDETDCGTGNMCLNIGYTQTYCGVDCSMGQECPRGYSCGAVIDIADNVVGYQCITACYLLE